MRQENGKKPEPHSVELAGLPLMDVMMSMAEKAKKGGVGQASQLGTMGLAPSSEGFIPQWVPRMGCRSLAANAERIQALLDGGSLIGTLD
jgi:hypothetical protein